MRRIMPDNDVHGQVARLVDLCQSTIWAALWSDLECVLSTFEDYNLNADSTDLEIWRTCQDNGVLLITGNRNADGLESLQTTIRERNTADVLPVLTLADPDRILRDREYAESVVERLFDVLIDVDARRGPALLAVIFVDAIPSAGRVGPRPRAPGFCRGTQPAWGLGGRNGIARVDLPLLFPSKSYE